MRGRRLIMRQPLAVDLEDFELDERSLHSGDLLVRNRFTAISPGTELASFTGLALESDVSDYGKYPFRPGYAAVGEVIAAGPDTPRFPVGQHVLHSSVHASVAIVRADAVAVPVPAGVPPDAAVFSRLAAISITARRLSSAEPGETVVVIGQGMIGNLAAQLFRLSGVRVLVVDPNESRLRIAAVCGLEEQLRAVEQVLAATGGAGAETVVDATGLPDPVAAAIDVVARFGELILLGTPRGRPRGDVSFTHFVGTAHTRSIRIIGAHASTSPQQDGTALPRVPVRLSIEANLRYILDCMRELPNALRLQVAPLRTHTLPPERATEAYAGLHEHPDVYLGVAFAWS